jgi:hypothetical protein
MPSVLQFFRAIGCFSIIATMTACAGASDGNSECDQPGCFKDVLCTIAYEPTPAFPDQFSLDALGLGWGLQLENCSAEALCGAAEAISCMWPGGNDSVTVNVACPDSGHATMDVSFDGAESRPVAHFDASIDGGGRVTRMCRTEHDSPVSGFGFSVPSDATRCLDLEYEGEGSNLPRFALMTVFQSSELESDSCIIQEYLLDDGARPVEILTRSPCPEMPLPQVETFQYDEFGRASVREFDFGADGTFDETHLVTRGSDGAVTTVVVSRGATSEEVVVDQHCCEPAFSGCADEWYFYVDETCGLQEY